MNIQKTAGEFVRRYNLETSVESRYIDLVSEVGEFGKEILNGNNYGKSNLHPTENMVQELGDVIFSLACIANTLKLDMEECVLAALEKYKKRYEKSGEVGS